MRLLMMVERSKRLQAQQMFSQGKNVAFLSSGSSNAALGSGGSGIFLAKYGTLAQVILPSNDSYYSYQKVPNESHRNITGTQLEIEDRNAKLMDNFFIMVEDLTAYSSKSLHIATQQIEETVCQKENGYTLCCYFKLQTNMERQVELDDGRPKYNYRAVARLGKRSFSGVRNLYMENCGVVACLNETLSSCGKRFSNYSEIQWPITFTSLEVSANFTLSDRKQQFPNSLLPDITPISAEYTQWTTKLYQEERLIERTFRILKPIKKLLTFGILGRNYEEDD